MTEKILEKDGQILTREAHHKSVLDFCDLHEINFLGYKMGGGTQYKVQRSHASGLFDLRARNL